MNGDVLTDMNFATFLENHIMSKRMFTIASHKRIHTNDYGVLKEKDNELVGFEEKPQTQFEVSMGIYAVSKHVLDYIPDNQFFGFDMLMLKLLEENITTGVEEYTGYWMDIGRPDDYQQAVEDIENNIYVY